MFFKININSKNIFAYQQAYVGTKIKAKSGLKIYGCGQDKFDVFDKNILRIDKRIDFLVVQDNVFIKNINVIQNYFKFDTFVRNQARNVIDEIESLGIVSDIEKIKECEEGEKLTIAKKLMKVKHSPVLQMDKHALLETIPTIERYRNIIRIENGRIKTSSKKDVNNLLKLLNDQYLKSELTKKEYDSDSKTLL